MTDVPVGYKQTEVGIIPNDWEIYIFGSVAKIFRGGSPRPIQAYLTTSPDGINWIKIGDVKANEKYINSTKEKIIKEGISRSREVHKGDFILSNSMSFGRPYILNIDGCIHDGRLTIQEYHKKYDKDFLYYLLSSEQIMGQYISMAAGSSVQNLNKEKVGTLYTICPSKPEQQEIATVLSDMDELIKDLEELIEKKKNIKKGTMQKLLTPKENRNHMKLGDICNFLKGRGLSKDKTSDTGNNECLLYGELFTTYNYIIEEIESRTNSQEGNPSKEGDVLIPGSTTTVGIDLAKASALLKEGVLLGGDINILRRKNKSEYNSAFLAYYLTEQQKYNIAMQAQGITIIHLYGRNLEDIDVYMPKDIEEQNSIVTILSDMDKEIEALEEKKAKYEQIKQGAMQKLLTGKIRLV